MSPHTLPTRRRWKQDLAPYLEIDRARSLGQIASAVVPYLAIWALAAALRPGGHLLATGLSTRCPFFGNGEELEPDTWSNPGWVPIHFYTAATLAAELASLRVILADERDEPEDKPTGQVLTPAVYALAERRTP